jgi:phosphoenolpyruvate-protein kinase (PTS system EI component)
VCLSSKTSPDLELTGKIVVTPNADPGFDWIFSRGIAGLLTMYGGTNSHMAIRAAEFQLPAATGIGEMLYEQVSKAEMLELDCASRQIRVIR